MVVKPVGSPVNTGGIQATDWHSTEPPPTGAPPKEQHFIAANEHQSFRPACGAGTASIARDCGYIQEARDGTGAEQLSLAFMFARLEPSERRATCVTILLCAVLAAA